MTGLKRTLLAAVAAFLGGCASQTYSPAQAPDYIIIKNHAAFYKLGPMQPGGPDTTLPADTRVKLIRQEMGYSMIQLDDQQTGYVANENMAVAPPLPKANPTPSDSSGRSSGKKHGAKYTGAPLNDTPLPEPNVPPPDLNIAPEELPAPTPTPTPPPEKPKFRL